MRRYIITGSILLSLSMACEEKKKTRFVPAPTSAVETVAPSPVDISLPSVVTDVEPVRTETSAAEQNQELPKTEAEASAPMKMAAKIIPNPAPIQYEDVSSRVLAEGSRDEAVRIRLDEIREKALLRMKKMQAEEERAAAQKVGAKIAMVEPETDADSVDPDETKAEAKTNLSPKAGKADLKANKAQTAQYTKAKALAKAGKIDAAKALFLTVCQSGYAHACHKFAWYEEQAGNVDNASQFYRSACDGGLGKSCNNLAFQFERQKVYDKALDLYDRGCKERHDASCTSLKRIKEELSQDGLKTR